MSAAKSIQLFTALDAFFTPPHFPFKHLANFGNFSDYVALTAAELGGDDPAIAAFAQCVAQCVRRLRTIARGKHPAMPQHPKELVATITHHTAFIDALLEFFRILGV